MIVNYSFENFKSFYDETVLKMQASQQTTYNDNLIRKNGLRVLPSAVIYGSNASGKSNLIQSLEVFKEIVIEGTISSTHGYLADLEIFPFLNGDKNKPMRFRLDFVDDNTRYIYEIGIHVGLVVTGERKIVKEALEVVKDKNKTITLFERSENSVTINDSNASLKYLCVDSGFISEVNQKLNANLDPRDLFLTSGFKNIINAKLADKIVGYFYSKLLTITDFLNMSSEIKINSKEALNESITVKNNLIEKFKDGADFGPQSIVFRSKKSEDEHSADLQMFSEFNDDKKHTTYLIPSQKVESKGTLKLIDFTIMFQRRFSNGVTFVIDEFDSALHSELVKGILSIFNSGKLNKSGSQLIFSTHNPIYLNNSIFRRDQIFFVEKDRETFHSGLYSLSDFGSKDVRNDENYLINYFKGKYSSLPYIDFASLISEEE